MANAEHLAVVRKGTRAIAPWRQEHSKTILDLRGAYLRRAEPWRANLQKLQRLITQAEAVLLTPPATATFK